VAALAVSPQKLLIDAAVKGGVKRIISSNIGCDFKNPKAHALPVYAAKVEIENCLKSRQKKMFNGQLLDWGLRNGMFFNFKKKADIYDRRDQLISASRLVTAGEVVWRILTHPRETADRPIWVKDIDVFQIRRLN